MNVLPDNIVQGFSEAADPPTKTYRLDIENGRITGTLIDGQDAMEQAAAMALLTQRFKSDIFDNQYGSELEEMLKNSDGAPAEYVTEQVRQAVTDALSVDTRILSVDSVESVLQDDYAYVAVTMSTEFGSSTVEVVT